MSRETKEFLREYRGFRNFSNSPFITEVIQASINRTDITYLLKPIPKDMLSNYRILDFKIRNAIDENNEPTLENIPKTLNFEDSRKGIKEITAYLRNQLVVIIANNSPDKKKYRFSSPNKKLDVEQVVSQYIAYLPTYNQDLRYDKYKKRYLDICLVIRIIYSTPLIALSYNISDILLVAIQKVPITKDIDDVNQKASRYIRSTSLYSTVVQFFLQQLDNAQKLVLEDIQGIYKTIVRSPTTTEGSIDVNN